MTWEEKTTRVRTIENLYNMFDTGRNLRKNMCVQTQTDVTVVGQNKVKDIALPSMQDMEIIDSTSSPFSPVLKFLNQDTIDHAERLTIEEPETLKMVNLKRYFALTH